MDMRVGVLGGTFDPVHNGHLIIAEEAQAKLGLSQVLFIPAGRPWFKDGENVSDMEWRLDMLRLAVEGNPSFSIDTQELERPGASYTVDTIEQLAARMGDDVQLYFIIGLDALAELGRWKEPRRLVSICHFATMRRPGYTDLDIAALDREVPGVSDRIHVLDNVQVDISSSGIRERVEQGLSIRYLVPPAVRSYIEEKGLYRAPSS